MNTFFKYYSEFPALVKPGNEDIHPRMSIVGTGRNIKDMKEITELKNINENDIPSSSNSDSSKRQRTSSRRRRRSSVINLKKFYNYVDS